jgi:hypothetical protein
LAASFVELTASFVSFVSSSSPASIICLSRQEQSIKEQSIKEQSIKEQSIKEQSIKEQSSDIRLRTCRNRYATTGVGCVGHTKATPLMNPMNM